MPAPLAEAVAYHSRPLLDHLTNGRYTTVTAPIDRLAREPDLAAKVRRYIDSHPGLSLASATDETLYLLWVHDYPGWLEFAEPLGLHIANSAKIAKRLTTLTRQAGAHAIGDFPRATLDAVDFLSRDDVSVFEQMGYDPAVCLDGGLVISHELLTTMASALSPVKAQHFLAAGSFSQVRVLCPEGLIKGDAIAAPRSAMGGYDLLYHPESLCRELASQTTYVIAEPRTVARKAVHECLDAGDPPILAPAWTDDQTMAWLGPWLWPKEDLDAAFDDVIEAVIGNLEAGRAPKLVTRGSGYGDSLSASVIRRAQAFESQGLGVGASVWLTYALGRQLLEHLNPPTRSPRWPIPCAGHPAVATDAWLHAAGRDRSEWPNQSGFTEPGTAWLHTPTGRLVYANTDFAALYSRHGGWDLDDTVTAVWREIDGVKSVVCYRQPNTYGEYAVARHPVGAWAPSWHSPTRGEISWPTLSAQDAPEYLENITTTHTHPGAFADDASGTRESAYTRQAALTSLADAIRANNVLGRWVNVEIAHHATFGEPRRRRVSSTEDVVDACTQTPTESAITAILDDAARARGQIDAPGVAIDPVIWTNRIAPGGAMPRRAHLTQTWWSRRTMSRSATLVTAWQRLGQASQAARGRVPQIIIELGGPYRQDGTGLVNWWWANLWTFDDGNDQSRFEALDRELARQVDEYGDHAVDVTLSMARAVYTSPRRRGWSDTLLFGPQMLVRYLTALDFYGLVEMDQPWQGLCRCGDCGQMWLSSDRVETQLARLGHRHCGCRARVSA